MTIAHLYPLARRVTDWTAAILVGVIAFRYGIVLFDGFSNDHFVILARTLQIFHGSWPVRDFFDPGMPLAYLTSYEAMRVFGRSLLVEAYVMNTFFAAAVGTTFLLARRASGSTLIGIAAAALVMAVPPRTYSASKVLVQVVAIALAWWYADAPRTARLVPIAIWAGVAFLFRHDYIVYITVAFVSLLVAVHYTQPWMLLRRIVLYAGVALLVAMPWLLYVQWAGGLVEYFASAMRFSAAEAERTWEYSTTLAVLICIPLTALIGARWAAGRLASGHLVFAGILVLLIDFAFLRTSLSARLPDVVGPSVVVAAWLLGAVLPRPIVSLTGALATAAIAFSVFTLQQRRGFGEWSIRNIDRHAERIERQLRHSDPALIPGGELIPVADYIARCTAPSDRILTVGFAPQLPVMAHRAFAAGSPAWIPKYYENPSDLRVARRWLDHEALGAVVTIEPGVLEKAWPALAEAIASRRFTKHHLELAGLSAEVWIPQTPAGVLIDAKTGLPCVSPQREVLALSFRSPAR